MVALFSRVVTPWTREFEALDQQIWPLEALKGKMVISGDSGEFLETFGVVGGSWHKRRALAKSGKFLGIFVEF
jgi:hypothetical protein